MVENIKDPSLTDYSIQHPSKVQKAHSQDSVIDHKDLKGILFLGVKGDIDIVSDDNSKLDFLV
ncbi:MAG: hypothetical protein FWF38_05425 [Spirochaetaceae bacterium]|nr:hypothetical protein [Spirochaetaceae bacterium]